MVRPSLTALAFILLVSAAPVLSGCGQKGALYLPQPEAAPADAEEDHDSESDDSGQSADTIQNARTVMVSGAQHGTVVNLNLHALAPDLDGTARGFAT
ncbi:MAG TPA: lipoprotein [Wenzhouxiangella sp.]|nr:lipoprotein [Wenzhouxiangella sp.]